MLFRESYRISIATSRRYQQIVEYGAVVFTESYDDNQSIRHTAAVNYPAPRILLLLSEYPTRNPKNDFHRPVYVHASSTVDNASSDILDHSRDRVQGGSRK